MAWWVVFLVLIMSIATFVKLTKDDNQKFHILKNNQDQLLCIVRESTNPVHTNIDPKTLKFTIDNSYIDKCIRDNK